MEMGNRLDIDVSVAKSLIRQADSETMAEIAVGRINSFNRDRMRTINYVIDRAREAGLSKRTYQRFGKELGNL